VYTEHDITSSEKPELAETTIKTYHNTQAQNIRCVQEKVSPKNFAIL